MDISTKCLPIMVSDEHNLNDLSLWMPFDKTIILLLDVCEYDTIRAKTSIDELNEG